MLNPIPIIVLLAVITVLFGAYAFSRKNLSSKRLGQLWLLYAASLFFTIIVYLQII